jgi:hypothetical protein
MFGINVSLFGLETVLFNSVCQTSEYLTFIIAFGGLSFSIWSIYVMQRLWSYHEHWKNMLCEAEKAFPDDASFDAYGRSKGYKDNQRADWRREM